MNKTKLPDWTWQLDAGDMCHGKYNIGDKYCLEGWVWKWVYEFIDVGPYSPMMATFHATDRAAAGWKKFVIDEIGRINEIQNTKLSVYNDSHTFDHNARAWNTTMRRLGYDIDEKACLPRTE